MKVVLPKGRLFNDSLKLLKKAGLKLEKPEDRELISQNGEYSIAKAKAFDVPVYVEHGIDIGIAGKDVYEERKNDVLVPLELPYGKCRLSLAVPEEKEYENLYDIEGYSIATEYVNITNRFFEEKNIEVDVFKLNGSVELGPNIGISDAIVDIVETGNTLRANNLVEKEKLLDISALLLVNRVSQKTKFDKINQLVHRIKEVIKNES